MRPNRNFRGGSGHQIAAGLVRFLAALALIGVGICPVRAQYMVSQPALPSAQLVQPLVASPPPTSGLPDLQVLVTPYAWMPWVGVGINPSNSRLPRESGTVDFGQILDHMTWVPFMGAIEFRDGPIGGLFDYVHAPLKAGVTTKDILFGSGQAGLDINIGTAMFFYRALVAPNQYLDAGLGVRAWGLAGDISLSGKRMRLPNFTVASGEAWADPLIGARYHVDLGNGYGATAYGDVGGFGLGAHIDWQLMGTVDYSCEPWIDLHAGFRTLNFNYSATRSGLNVNLYGPIIAATFRF